MLYTKHFISISILGILILLFIGITCYSPSEFDHLLVSSNLSSTTSPSETISTQSSELSIPADVANVSALPDDKQVILSWENPDDDSIVQIFVVRKETGNPTEATDGEIVCVTTGTTCSDPNVINDTLYYYSIFTQNLEGTYSGGISISSTPQDRTPPADIINLSITSGDEQLTLDW